MGYACPVCETPQADAGHLANHLAFTAMLGNDDHERWLDEHAPGWNEAGERELADRVVEYAPDVEFPQVFEDTTDASHHDHDEPRPGALFDDDHDHGLRDADGRDEHGGHDSDAPSDPEVARAMAEARELMGQRRDGDTDGDIDESAEDDEHAERDDQHGKAGGAESQ